MRGVQNESDAAFDYSEMPRRVWKLHPESHRRVPRSFLRM